MKFARRMLNLLSFRRGFTLIEMMIVISLVVLLTTVAAVSNKAIGHQVLVSREHAKALALFVRARSAGLTIPKAAPGELICAYGVFVDPLARTLILFKDLGAGSCASANQSYDGGTEEVSRVVLDSAVTMVADFAHVGFIPPSGTVFIDSISGQSGVVTITGAIAGLTRSIKVNAFGQVTEYETAP